MSELESLDGTTPIVIYVQDGEVKAVLNSSGEVSSEYVVFDMDVDPADDIAMFDIPLPNGDRAISYVTTGPVFLLSEDVEECAWAFIEGHV